jgi:hypothetical protein
MVTRCQVERCDRCALARAYPERPEVRQPPAHGWQEVLAELQRLDVPLVAFGQTILWDEAAKAVLRLILDQSASDVLTVAGIHDSDYFSKLHGRGRTGEGFVLWSNNDWTHRDLWAAVGETTSLFGAETPPKVEDLKAAGVPLKQLAGSDPVAHDDFLDEATTSYGWRGVAQLGAIEQIARDVPIAAAGESLVELLAWGLDETVSLLADPAAQEAARGQGDKLLERLRAAMRETPEATVSDIYRRLIAQHYADLLGYTPDQMRTTATCDYLRFNRDTAGRPRFQALQAFLCDRVGDCARETYDEAVKGEGMYGLEQFGPGAVPFDLVVPGRGRGTLRILDDAIEADLSVEPLVIPTERRIIFLEELAECLEDAVGPDVAIVGKALLGPVMFCSEAILALHEGASAYVPRTQLWLRRLNQECASLRSFPILRLRHRAYDALGAAPITLRLPDHLAEAFGAPEVSAGEFGQRWRHVIERQEALLTRLGSATSCAALLEVIAEEKAEEWHGVARRLGEARSALREVGALIEQHRVGLVTAKARERTARTRRAELERSSGRLRDQEKETGDPQPRQQLREELAELDAEVRRCEKRRAQLREQIRALAHGETALAARQTIERIAHDAELERLALARRALLTRNMEVGNRRPTGWWFTVADPSGRWFKEATRLAEVWLEDLAASSPEL